jgi:hypothetical protein
MSQKPNRFSCVLQALGRQKNAGSFGAIYEVNEIKTVRGPYVKPWHRPSDLLAKLTYLPHVTKALDVSVALATALAMLSEIASAALTSPLLMLHMML